MQVIIWDDRAYMALYLVSTMKTLKNKKKIYSREFINLSLINTVLTSLVKCPTSCTMLLTKPEQFQKMSIPKQDSSNADSQPWNQHSQGPVENPLSAHQNPLQSWSSFPLEWSAREKKRTS